MYIHSEPVHDTILVTIEYRTQYLTHSVCSFLLTEMFLFGDLVKQLTTRAQFCHNVEESLILVEFINFDYVGMI